MSQFDEIVKNIALENEKCGYNPEEFRKNWSFLDEYNGLRNKCIKLMDAKTKVRLSETNHFYRRLAKEGILKLDYIAENIALENEKSNYNPKIDMNWCNLPTEIRYECVKRMDFKNRCGFRGVSKFEKSLVDSRKNKFEHLQIKFMGKLVDDRMIRWSLIAKSENGKSELHVRTENRLNEKCLAAIFKHAEVKNFRLNAYFTRRSEVRPILKQLAQFAPFQFKRVSVFGIPSIDFLMQTFPNLEKVDISDWLSYKKMLKFPWLMKVKEFRLSHLSPYDLLDFLSELVQKWIDKDVEVGKSVQFDKGFKGIVNMVAEKFADRIIEKTDKEVRIRMNNGKTQILMRSLGSNKDPDEWNYSLEYCSCKVVPIDLPTSEYPKGDEWIQAIMERSQRHTRLENAPGLEAEDKEIYSSF